MELLRGVQCPNKKRTKMKAKVIMVHDKSIWPNGACLKKMSSLTNSIFIIIFLKFSSQIVTHKAAL